MGAAVCAGCAHTCVRPGVTSGPAAPPQGAAAPRDAAGGCGGVLSGCPRALSRRGLGGCSDRSRSPCPHPEGLSLLWCPTAASWGFGGAVTPPRGDRGWVAVTGWGCGRMGTVRIPQRSSGKGKEGQPGRFPQKAAGDRTVSPSVTTAHAQKLRPRFLPGCGEGTSSASFPGCATSQGTGNGAQPPLER